MDDLLIDLQQWIKANPLEIPSDAINNKGFGGKTMTSFEKGHKLWNTLDKTFMSEKVSESKKEYWKQWREQNPDYKSKWKVYNYEKKGWNVNSSKNIKEMNMEKVTCPHCGKQGNVGNMKRWHFDNCGNR
jgi:endogenous inhibitor of DNA gyrase (YacG/DUF329 family)